MQLLAPTVDDEGRNEVWRMSVDADGESAVLDLGPASRP
jgi:hypothetical protein